MMSDIRWDLHGLYTEDFSDGNEYAPAGTLERRIGLLLAVYKIIRKVIIIPQSAT
jgi:hypothetical protein